MALNLIPNLKYRHKGQIVTFVRIVPSDECKRQTWASVGVAEIIAAGQSYKDNITNTLIVGRQIIWVNDLQPCYESFLVD